MLIFNGTDNNLTIVEGLKNKVHVLKIRYSVLKKVVGDMQSIYDTHQCSLETFQQHIVKLKKQRGMLDLAYQEKQL